MFAGHAAVALAARSTLPTYSLGVLFAASYFIDLLWPLLLLAGLERVEIDPGNTAFTPLNFAYYPWTHGMLTAAWWGVVFAVVSLGGHLQPVRDVLWLTALVLSHWFLDFITHRPDLPLTPWTASRFGLGLWNSIPGTLLVEGALFAGGIAIYLRVTSPKPGTGSLRLWSLLGLVAVIWAAGPFSPPPPSARAIGVVGLISWLLPLWAHWADRQRTVKRPESPAER